MSDLSGLSDGYDDYYQARLWESLPAMYQAMDIIGEDTPGPLQELLNRIGAQVAVARRGIDGLWADQSIETCADWVIPYLGDLVAAQPVTGLDPRGQRLDVANTIHWRRRKGTLATANAVASDITGWYTHVSEAFRRLARTRHDLDPPPRTGEGGLADLRSVPVALLTPGPFDETFHHADLRRGPAAGPPGIQALVVYCWRLLSLQVIGADPVRVAGRPDEYVFDPTGRETPLFLPPPRPAARVTRPWQVPGPLTAAVDRMMTEAGVPAAYQISAVSGPVSGSTVRPEAGRFRLTAPPGEPVTVSYYRGSGGPIGAGTGTLAAGTRLLASGERLVAGGAGLDGALAAARGGDTVTVADSRTYAAVADVACAAGPAPAAPLTVRARPGERPLVRLTPHDQPGERTQWVFHGGAGARLVLDGLFVSGGDIVLRGPFEHVRITGCTLDPGTRAGGAAGQRPDAAARRRRRHGPAGTIREPDLTVGTSVDGRPLLPVRVWIEPGPAAPGRAPGPPDVVRCLEIDRSVLGPVRTRAGGLAERVVVTDSILQGFPTSAGPAWAAADIFDPVLLYDQLSPGRAEPARPRAQQGPLSAFIWRTAGGEIPPAARRRLLTGQEPPASARQALADALNTVAGRDIYRPGRWAGVQLSTQTRALLARDERDERDGRGGRERELLNRLLLEDAYPLALAPAALAIAEATVRLNRATVLGRVHASRLHATDSILHGFTVAEDTEDGCFRYSAALSGSRLPPRFNAVWLSGGAALFTSTAFGHPGYGQLLDTADRAIAAVQPGAAGRGLLSGSSAGAQLGAFPAQAVPAKERALRVKYNEYLPFGLVPTIVHVT